MGGGDLWALGVLEVAPLAANLADRASEEGLWRWRLERGGSGVEGQTLGRQGAKVREHDFEEKWRRRRRKRGQSGIFKKNDQC